MIEAVDWREYDAFFAHCRRSARRRRRCSRCRRSSCPTRASTGPSTAPTSSRPPSSPAVACRRWRRSRPRHIGSGFSLTRLDDIGLHYAETLRRWRANLAARRDELATLGLDERFVRLWEFYFSYCEAGFDERYVSVVQLLYAGAGLAPAALAPRRAPRPLHPGR